MELTENTKIDKLLKEYPFLIDFLPKLSPEYNKLKNPLMRKTFGKIVNLKTVAKIGGMETLKLISVIENEITRKTKAVTTKPPTPVSHQKRKEILKGIIRDLHKGEDMAILKKRFAELIKDISPSEISEMEQGLIAEGMPESKVKRLCDVHVEIFKQSLERQKTPTSPSGHPVHTFMMENRKTEKILNDIEDIINKMGHQPEKGVFKDSKDSLLLLLDKLMEVEKHYLRKENQLFPLLEAHNVSGPTQVMWSIHDDIRAVLKDTRRSVSNDDVKGISRLEEANKMIRDMIYKEEHILFPMSLETLSESEWIKIRKGEEELGYAWITPGDEWKPKLIGKTQKPIKGGMQMESVDDSYLQVKTGKLSLEQINLMLTHLPVDLSFVNENDEVAYYSDVKDRIFPRSPGIIGRKVQKCHPPKSVHKVQKILNEFKEGSKDVAAFWIQLGGRFIHIRYFAVRDSNGKYKGTLEVSQDITEIKKLEGEKRLLDWE
jgi:DUF438 domain-containing protein